MPAEEPSRPAPPRPRRARGTPRVAGDPVIAFGLPVRLPPMKYMCESCGFIYDPADGDPDGGIPPGTQFEDIPDTWFCPVCGARKKDFSPYEG